MNDPRLDRLGRGAARGDHEAFAALCRLVQGDVWRYCLAVTGDPDLAEEAGQETFVRAAGAIRRYRGDGPVRVWLLVLARRAAAEVLRRDRRVRTVPLESAEPSRPAETGLVEVGELLAALPSEQRQAFALTQVLGLTYAEAAAVAGCRVGTIRSRVFRARAQLVAQLGGEEDAHDAHG